MLPFLGVLCTEGRMCKQEGEGKGEGCREGECRGKGEGEGEGERGGERRRRRRRWHEMKRERGGRGEERETVKEVKIEWGEE